MKSKLNIVIKFLFFYF